MASGYLINYKDMPGWFIIKYISPTFYAFEAMLKNEFDDLQDADQLLIDQSLDKMHFPHSFTEAVIYLSIIIIGMRIANGILLKLVNLKT
jgi:hypothetical protein